MGLVDPPTVELGGDAVDQGGDRRCDAVGQRRPSGVPGEGQGMDGVMLSTSGRIGTHTRQVPPTVEQDQRAAVRNSPALSMDLVARHLPGEAAVGVRHRRPPR